MEMNEINCKCGAKILTNKKKIYCPQCGEKWLYVYSLQRFASSTELNEKIKAVGVTNHLRGHKRYLQVDYDTKNFSEVEEDINQLHKNYSLSVFLIMATKNGFHVISPHVLSISKTAEILATTSCDEQFKEKMRKKKYTTLRISPKYISENSKLKLVSPEPEFHRLIIKPPAKRPLICRNVITLYEVISKQPIFPVSPLFYDNYDSKIQIVVYRTLKG